MKISYNAPITLTFTFAATIIFCIHSYIIPNFNVLFSVPGDLKDLGFVNSISIISHVLGHATWEHLLGNLSLILILGPILEEKYSSLVILIMILITAFVTGVLNIFFFDTGLLGASGIVFMMILLSSITNIKSGTLPLTFVLVVVFYLGNEIISTFKEDQISQFAHIIGGICGAFFGFIINKDSSKKSSPKAEKAKPQVLKDLEY